MLSRRIISAARTAAPIAKPNINNSNQTELIDESQRIAFTLERCTV
jgi:hypothetical protein